MHGGSRRGVPRVFLSSTIVGPFHRPAQQTLQLRMTRSCEYQR
jgi:hypothetical protein